MDVLLLVHALAGLFTVAFAVYTGIHVFHRISLQHRIDKMSRQIAPMIVAKKKKEQVIESLKKEGHVEHEISELFDKLSLNFGQNSQNKQK